MILRDATSRKSKVADLFIHSVVCAFRSRKVWFSVRQLFGWLETFRAPMCSHAYTFSENSLTRLDGWLFLHNRVAYCREQGHLTRSVGSCRVNIPLTIALRSLWVSYKVLLLHCVSNTLMDYMLGEILSIQVWTRNWAPIVRTAWTVQWR